jgi:hypothetical protein
MARISSRATLKTTAVTQKLYDALFGISTLRQEVSALAAEMTRRDESRFLVRLGLLEAAAIRLIDESELHGRVSSH